MFSRGVVLPCVAFVACAVSPLPTVTAAQMDKLDRKAWAEACADWDEWEKPGPPYRIHGNTYYVGTCGISAILISGDDGHVLIDSGTDAGAALVAANIEALGFTLSDVKILLMSHEH